MGRNLSEIKIINDVEKMCFITTKKLNKLLDERENKKKDNMGPLNMD